ncbi:MULTISPECIES: bifunctional 4-hydroxy-2-oxoglutarate aldolase/2-dehydro-3-deoxy-phosphogluconate aldolase [unclassified Streptomyces]|uniref:bifunctional 4-hydroxy-2-oxoglutarate aldolase/2-dehydro-3-deoxy-phosphogluconate aldolase n=1 Tax=unclassified Streptomyces TaxID=2593676 RepID=UPI00190305CF|nr:MULTISPECIES: bifunctional 4-hydroxy-2-oxoglutarate aldolase/2-dehydro-3-deoxy-phosphogluconate aldolase [unclassified Streptomyces]MCU4749780.1 bifunctional 4-hydroxy-2-oxoglutarate aldolase/2-dehydro-3-deoxy-phosphogluconate aldolase [Streptomyces sp. G-5]QQN76087.1 bifunctional 4-hydroxy-2-oxoglutarate aldolase/2-dehydro-3-deoxy-phosphogluconate aldolase [Streptomyces sp. XC 2026]
MTSDPSAAFFARHLSTGPVLGIFRGQDPRTTVDLCLRAWEAGVELVEIPVQSEDALPSLEAAVKAAGAHGKHVGAGTVTTVERLRAARDLGASFTVAPGLHPPVVEASQGAGLPHLPGAATATDIAGALAAGYTWVKAFPAQQLGPGWITAHLAPFPDVRFVATGGVGPGNAADFLAAGCAAVAIGSALSDPGALRRLREALNTRT